MLRRTPGLVPKASTTVSPRSVVAVKDDGQARQVLQEGGGVGPADATSPLVLQQPSGLSRLPWPLRCAEAGDLNVGRKVGSDVRRQHLGYDRNWVMAA